MLELLHVHVSYPCKLFARNLTALILRLMDEVARVPFVAVNVGLVVQLTRQSAIVLCLHLLHLHLILLLYLLLFLYHELLVVFTVELDKQPAKG